MSEKDPVQNEDLLGPKFEDFDSKNFKIWDTLYIDLCEIVKLCTYLKVDPEQYV